VSISSLGSVALSGATSVSPAQTTTYTLTASNKLGQTTASVTVTVSAAPPMAPPTIVSFSANPQQIALGAQSTLVWQVLNATDVSISSLGAVGGAGSQNVSPAATTTYTLTASNASGQVTATATVTVLLPAKILSFTATPSTITAGDTVLLSWTTENATTIRIYDIGNVVANGSLQVNPKVDTVYTLYVSGAVGLPSTAQVAVKVNPASTPKPPVANVGPTSLQTNALSILLDARGSTDPNGLPLTFSWVSVNPTATLINPTSATPIAVFGVDRGDYMFTVTVTNSAGLSSSASVTVTYVHPRE
jgi:plastocyanin